MFLQAMAEEAGDVEIAIISDDGSGEFIIDFPQNIALMEVPTEDGNDFEIVAGIVSATMDDEFNQASDTDYYLKPKLSIVKDEDDNGGKGFLN